MRASCRHLTSAARGAAVTPLSTPYSWINPATPGPSSTGKLAGRNIAIKDNISYSSGPTSCSSQILDEYYPPYTATCVTSLLAAGAHIAGQTKMDEFGMGSETTHLPPSYSPVHNPASPHPNESPRSAGGSSGGSAVAVAEGSCWAALGTDTGGSVRLPASYCGVVGLKPSYGMISRYGVVSYADSLDCVGILGKSVDTVQQVFGTISHPDPKDMTCVSQSVRKKSKSISQSHFSTSKLPGYSSNSPDLTNLRIGIPTEMQLPRPNLQIPQSLLDHLRNLGATLNPISLPTLAFALPAYYVLASAEASSNLARFGGGWFGSDPAKHDKSERDHLDGDRVGEQKRVAETGEERRRRIRTQGFGQEVKKRILAGTHALSADEFNNTYLKALHLRRLLRHDLLQTFRIPHPLYPSHSAPAGGIDILLHPTAIRTAPPLTESSAGSKGRSKPKGSSEYAEDLLTVPASLAGLPAMSIPAGRGEDGWPVGMSVTGQWGMEEALFWVGRGIETWRGGEAD